MSAKPQLLSWLICDAVHMDPATGKQYIMGVFSNLRARAFPIQHPRMTWFLSITDVAVGKHMLKISFGKDIQNSEPVVEREFESRSPLHRLNLVNEIQGLRFDSAGSHYITVEVDDVPLLVTSIHVDGPQGQQQVSPPEAQQ